MTPGSRPALLYADTQDPVSQLCPGIYVLDPAQTLEEVTAVSLLLEAELDAVNPQGSDVRAVWVRRAHGQYN